jgi:hypothetical protein
LKQATGAEEANPEDAEIDYEGEKFKVPAKLKDAFPSAVGLYQENDGSR